MAKKSTDTSKIIKKIRDYVTKTGCPLSVLSTSSGLHTNTCMGMFEADWNPKANTLKSLETFINAQRKN